MGANSFFKIELVEEKVVVAEGRYIIIALINRVGIFYKLIDVFF